MRTPLPAASTTTVTRGSDETARLGPADALARMGGIAADYSFSPSPLGGRIGEGVSIGTFTEQASQGGSVSLTT